jgi:hypothetical protein
VDSQSASFAGCSFDRTSNQVNFVHRQQSTGLGGALAGSHNPGAMDSSSTSFPHQCSRDVGYPIRSFIPGAGSKQGYSFDLLRQHVSGSGFGETGFDSVTTTQSLGDRNMGMGLTKGPVSEDLPSAREGQHPRGSSVAAFQRSQQLEVGTRGFSDNQRAMGPSRCGPLCGRHKPSIRGVHQLVPRSEVCGGRRPPAGLDTVEEPLRIPAVSLDSQGVGNDQGSQSYDHFNNPGLANPAVVSRDPVHVVGTHDATTIVTASSSGSAGEQASLSNGEPVVSAGLPCRSSQLTPAVRLMLENSVRPSTKRLYLGYWKHWVSYCLSLGINSWVPTINDLCNFLVDLRDRRKLSFMTINGYRSAVLFYLGNSFQFSSLDLRLLQRLMKSIRNLQPPNPRYPGTWDVDKVLTYIISLGENCRMDVKFLSMKLAFLLSSVAVLRVSELVNINVNPWRKDSNAWVLRLNIWKKNTSASNRPHSSITIPFFVENPLLCPILCLQSYLSRTLEWRSHLPISSSNLFLSISLPHHPISKDTASRWLKRLLSLSAIDTDLFKAHSIRGAVSSKACARGISIDEILRAADWSTENTFTKFYKRQLDTGFANAVLALN